MGTHPIFESDFDCLTELLSEVMERRSARRNLFGKSQMSPQALENSKKEAASQKWNFDFHRERPLPKSPSDKFDWEQVAEHNVPEFYKSTNHQKEKSSTTKGTSKARKISPKKTKKAKGERAAKNQRGIKQFVVMKRRTTSQPDQSTISKKKIEENRVYFKTRSMAQIQTRSRHQVVDYSS